jgi:hypothetical protein
LELTQEQKDRFPQFLAEWMKHGLSTSSANRPLAETGVRMAYQAAGQTPPQHIFWLGSPLAGAIVDTVISKVSESGSGNRPVAARQSPQKYSDRILAVVDSCMPLIEALSASEKKKVSREFVISCLSDLQLHNAAYGQHDASILCFYDFFAQVCGVEECRKLEGLNLVAQSCGWWWAYDSVAILTERPQRLSLDDRGRLHADSDWAILYPDGFGYCLVHGVEVPEHVVLSPEKITVAEIEAEANVEVRRVMIEKYGQARYLLDSGAVEIHKDDWGILYRKEIADDEAIQMVKVVNSTPEPDGSHKDYFIRTPPTLTTARASVAWTFAQDEGKYHPEIET